MTIQSALQLVEDLMVEVVDSEVHILRDASRHILEAGGKRVRPRLLLLSYAAAGGDDLSRAVPVAAAVELVHTASVVHDDINDHGIVRRGRPSVNAIWGRTFALLTGDYLFTKVYELMAPYQDLNMVLAEATVALVEGETLQASAVKEQDFSREVYQRIIALKTAALFKAAAKMGAQLAGADEPTGEALGQYGFNLGLAFQIVDDLLDLTADTEKLGKTAGIDVAQGRGFAVAYGTANGHTASGVILAEQTEDAMTLIKKKALRSDTLEEAHRLAHHLAQLAIAHLSVLSESDAKDGLVQLAHLVVERER